MIKLWILIIIIHGSPVKLGEYNSKQNCQQALEVTKKLRNSMSGWPFNERFVSSVIGCIPTMKEGRSGVVTLANT